MLHPHLWPDTATVDDAGQLNIAGVSAAALARQYGTPLYVFDEATLRAQCRAFRQAFESRWPQSTIAYASKAYLSLALGRLLLEEGLELDVVSVGEMDMALAAGYPAERLHLHGNFKPDAELQAALEAGIGRVVVDSLDELERLEALAAVRKQRVAIWLRLCPEIEVETHAHIQTGHADSKFGLSGNRGEPLEAVERAIRSSWLDLVGLHLHLGSHLRDMEPLRRAVTWLGEFAAMLNVAYGVNIRELSPGGGLGVAYTPEDHPPDIEAYAEAITDALRAVNADFHLEPPRLIVEPGRAIVARAGVALYSIGPRKVTSGGKVILAVDGGMGDNIRPALYGAKYHAVLAERVTGLALERVRVVGRYCESGDTLIDAVKLPAAVTGNILAIPVSGAYHLPMASSYNLVPRPVVVFVKEGHVRLVRRRETLDDLLRLEREE
ncbi:MAG TPA: diaminopimelate decarboxylase [Ktedonobacterales bacterium]|jgi:diaminopimelate decarboxylase